MIDLHTIVVPVAVEAMGRFSSEGMQWQGCRLLARFARVDVFADTVVDEGGVGVVVIAVGQHGGSARVRAEARNVFHCAEVCEPLGPRPCRALVGRISFRE